MRISNVPKNGSLLLQVPVKAGDVESPAHDPQEWEASDAGHFPVSGCSMFRTGKSKLSGKERYSMIVTQRVKES